ncbi:fibronectin type III domain-containing protein [Croceimicrobium hydrocarbonivorans]|uniref:T9SS type A sorting domain-containing protein n=1 Tax=Croceimicrobium hydrocarbonivorans TaxID=2761580 RepID=A0A7H0VCW9_9FLAO|nr:fibronectin type III domain-containing protein [Croceimicrobium hydrocarbonivorans]QNR23567.1 T9SS type A sorting domain-containing protein [Croceimicrobium hydrocarbonivorans]
MRKHLLALGVLVSGALFGQGTITTSPPLTPNNGSNGIAFRVEATSPIEITGLTNVFSTGATSATVWVRQGGVTPGGTPSITAANGWSQVVVNAPITGANSTALNNIPFGGVKIPVPSGGAIGIFIEGTTGTTRYQTGTSADQVIFTDGTATVSVADSVAYGGPASSPSNNPRRFVGTLTYALSVTGNCTPFTGFAIDSISGTAAKVNWTPGTGNTGYKIEYGPVGFTPGTGTVVSGTYPTSPVTPPVVLTGLSPNTNYDLYLEEYCNTGTDTVGFPTPQGFTTTKLCGAPTGFAESNLTSNSVDVSWSQAGSYTEAWLMWGPAGTAPGSAGWNVDTIMSPTMTHTIPGLSPSTAYDIYLATNCGAVNGVSDTVGPIQIVTPIQGPQGFTCSTGQPGLIFQDDFESQLGWTGDFGTGTTASNWNYHSGTTSSTNTGPTGAHSGTNYLYTEVSGTAAGTNIEAISPRIDLSTSYNSAELSFWLHAFGADIDTIKVQVGLSATGPWNTVFTRVGQVQTANADPWQQVGVNLDSYVGSAIYIRFLTVHGASFDGDVSIDLVEVNSCQTCPFPGAPSITYVSSDSAAFSWSGSGYDYDVSWGPRGFSQGSSSASLDSTTTNSIGIGGLNGNTAYDIYIRNDCSDSANGTSGWVGPVTFVTLCNALTAPYFNNFDTDSINHVPICWDNALIGGTSTTLPNADVEVPSTTYPPISSPNVVRFYNYNTDTAWLITPQFSDLSAGDKRIVFYGMTTTTTTPNPLVVGTIASPGDRSSFVPIDTIELQRNYAQYVVELTTANGYNGTHEFIVLENAGPDFRTYYIDDFVYEQIPACNPPLVSTLGINYVSSTTAEVSWGSGSTGDTTWIEWGLPGFTPGSSNLGRIAVTGAQDSALISGLTAQTTYEFYIQDSCNGVGNSPYVGPLTFTTACAITSPAILPINDGFENYSSGPTFTNTTFLCNPTYYWTYEPGISSSRGRLQANSAFYRNGLQAFTLDNSIFIDPSETSYLTMTVDLSGYTSAGGVNLSFYLMDHSNQIHPDNKVWVRGDHSDPWVEVVDLNTTVFGTFGSYDSIINLDIKAPLTNAGQSLGANTQIRWGQNDFGSATSATCCYGYTIDDVSLTAVACPDPTGLTTAGLFDTTATLTWASSGAASQYQYWFGPAGFYQGTTTTGGQKGFTSGSSVVVDTLTGQTCYEFLVRTVCSAGDSSAWAGPYSFCTPCSPISAPYFNDFDNLPQGKDLGCFNSIEDPSFASSNFLGVTIQNSTTYQPVSSPNTVEFDNSSLTASPLLMVSPPTSDMTAGDKRLRFFARSTSVATVRTLIVGTISNPTDASTFTAMDTLVMTLGMTEYIVDLTAANGYNGTDNYFAIAHGQLQTFQYIYLDDLHYETIPTCVRPNALTVSGISQNAATVSWTNANGNTSANYQMEYGIGPLGDPGNIRMLTSNSSVSLTSLTAGTGYCVWVREICSPGDTSFWRGAECFSTPCPVSYNAPYFTNFEGISLGAATGTPAGWENCWTQNSTSGTLRWESEDSEGANENSLDTGPFTDNTLAPASGGTYMFLETSTSGGPAELISPGIDISTVSNPELEYHYHMYGATMNKLVVYAENSSGTRIAIDSIIGQQQTAGSDPFLRRNVSLASLPVGVYNFIFEGHLGTSFTGDISLDDISVQQGATCPRPLNLSGDPQTTTSAIARWGSTALATSYQVEYGPTGFSAGTGTLAVTTADSIVLTFATANNLCQDVYVRAICPAGDTSVWLGPVAVCPEEVTCDNIDQYDASLELYDQSALFIPWAGNAGDVEIITSQSSSAPNAVHIHDQGPNGFSDLVAYFDTISAGAWEISFDLYVPTGNGAYYNVQQNHIGGATGNLWGGEIYFLDNGTADVVYTTGSNLAGSFNYTQGQWITVGTVIDLANDSIWIRLNGVSTGVGYAYSAANAGGPLQFNGVNFYSGVRQTMTYDCDYYFDNFCINPYVPASCPPITGLASTANIGCDSVEIDWTSGSGNSLLEYGPAGFSPGTGTTVSVSSTPIVVNTLLPGTAYDFYVSDICGVDTSAAVSITETTASGPLPTASFTVNETIIGNTMRVIVDASASTGASSYSWVFSNGSMGSGVIDTNTYLANGTYTVYLTVSNACGYVVDSATVLVNIGIDENPLAQSLNVYPNPAKDRVRINFTEVGSADVEIYLRDAQGRDVLHRSDRLDGGQYSGDLDLSGLASGVYMIEIHSGGLRAHRRLTIH